MLSLVPDDIKRDSTIVRIRGEMFVQINGTSGGGTKNVVWYAGMVVVSEDAMGVGGSSLPDPELDDGDWMWHDMGFMRTNVVRNDADTADLERGGIRYIEVESKAMRKLMEDNKTLAYIFKNDASSSSAVTQSIAARILLKTH